MGVGSGRFAAALGAEVGIDPARTALTLARRRGVRVAAGVGEALPFATGSCGTVLLVLTLCFVRDPAIVLAESRWVLAAGGGTVLGLVPADSPWGRHDRALAAAGHPYYRHARFFTRDEMASTLASAGLAIRRTRSSLLWPPGGSPASEPRVREGWGPAAGFVALLAEHGIAS